MLIIQATLTKITTIITTLLVNKATLNFITTLLAKQGNFIKVFKNKF